MNKAAAHSSNRRRSTASTTLSTTPSTTIIDGMTNPTTSGTSQRHAGAQTRLPQTLIDDVLARTDLVALIRESTPLREVSGQHLAHCPFHRAVHTAKPSLAVDRETQGFECSVCGFSGSAIGWLMYHDGLSFSESMLALSSAAGVDVSPWITPMETHASLRHRLDTLDACADLYTDALHSPTGDKARAYLSSRGISLEIARRFRLGVAAGGMTVLEHAFPHRARELWRFGVVFRYADKRFEPRFIDRLVFPILSTDGDVVAFGGRALGDQQPKYMNSSASPVFKKREILYGWPQAFDDTASRDSVFLVEGYLDVISLAQSGIRNVVGTLGTAVSEEQLLKLSANTRRVVCCFDGDDAGQAAALQCLHTALPCLGDIGMLEFMFLPDGHDPDSFVRAHGAHAFLEKASSAISAEDFLFETLVQDVDPASIGELARLGITATPIVSTINDSAVQHRIIARLDAVIGVPWFEVD